MDPVAPSVPSGGSRRRILGLAAALFAVTLLVHSRATFNAFVLFDDDVYLFDNPLVARGLSAEGLRWAFTEAHAANWHPLTWLSHMTDCELFGLRPGPHHLVSAVLHALNASILLLAFWSMTRVVWPSVLVAAMFALHPLRVESVAWASERKDVLSGLFFMLVLLAWPWYVRRPGPWRYALVAVLLALGLLSKPMLVTLPLLLVLIDVWPLGRLRVQPAPAPKRSGKAPAAAPTRGLAELIVEKLPLLGLALASSVITVLAQRGGGAVGTVETLPIVTRVIHALTTYGAYLVQTVWPVGTAFFYPHPALLAGGGAGGRALAALGAAIVLAAISWGVCVGSARRPYVVTGWLWYLIALVPVIGVIQVGMQARADRYTYLPAIGLYVLAAWGARDLVRARPLWRWPVVGLAGALLVVWAGVSWVRIGDWRDTRTLAERALDVTRGNFVAHTMLGLALDRAGDREAARKQYVAALEAKPGYSIAHNNLGLLLQADGRTTEAETELRRAIESRPGYAEAHLNLGFVLRQQRRVVESAESFKQALRLRPNWAEAYDGLGVSLLALGDLGGANEHLERAVALRPAWAEAWNNLGAVREKRGDLTGAARNFERAIALDANHPEAHYNLGLVRMREGRADEAERGFARTLELRPDHADAHNYLGSILERRNDLSGAAAHFEQALAANPALVEARYNLGVVFARRGDLGRAAAEFERALVVRPDFRPAREGLQRIQAR